MQRAQDQYDAYVAEHFRRGAMRQLTDEERQAIVHGLKENWEQLYREYLQMSVVIDTVPKQHRKERLESDMKQLERDVELFELHPIIYVGNWPSPPLNQHRRTQRGGGGQDWAFWSYTVEYQQILS